MQTHDTEYKSSKTNSLEEPGVRRDILTRKDNQGTIISKRPNFFSHRRFNPVSSAYARYVARHGDGGVISGVQEYLRGLYSV